MIEKGLDPGDQSTPACIEATTFLARSWRTFRYKLQYDEVYLTNSFNSLSHKTITLDVEHPTVAVSSLFSLGDFDPSLDISCVALNVFPITQQKTLAIFSWLPKDTSLVRQEFDLLFQSEEFTLIFHFKDNNSILRKLRYFSGIF
jgi:hypothetical protein